MICPDCDGKGFIDATTEANLRWRTKLPCALCGCHGIVHCCEGHQATPEAKAAWTPDNPRPDDPTRCRCGATAADPHCFCGC